MFVPNLPLNCNDASVSNVFARKTDNETGLQSWVLHIICKGNLMHNKLQKIDVNRGFYVSGFTHCVCAFSELWTGFYQGKFHWQLF